MPRVASKYQKQRENTFFMVGRSPSSQQNGRDGACPVSPANIKSKGKIHFFWWDDTLPANKTVETGRAPCRQQISTNKEKIQSILEANKKNAACHTKRERIVFAALKVPNFLVTAGAQHLRTINSTPSAVGAESALHKGVNACTGKWISVFGCC